MDTIEESAIAAAGGEVCSTAGDGLMCMFSEEAAAARAARELQAGLPRFNAERNRLPLPFRLRCGISAGEVALEPGIPLGHLHSPVIDRAAFLQKRAEPGGVLVGAEAATAAAAELEGLAPLPEPVASQTVFAWPARPPSGPG